jgi:hypothetical protein
MEIQSIVGQVEEVVVRVVQFQPQTYQVEMVVMEVLPVEEVPVVVQVQIQVQLEMVGQAAEVKFGFILGK